MLLSSGTLSDIFYSCFIPFRSLQLLRRIFFAIYLAKEYLYTLFEVYVLPLRPLLNRDLSSWI